ncbi:MAG: hypothetical protein INR73_06975 [Williamsia sp.]|nr:hypothetical protein [Williamsia sp.]
MDILSLHNLEPEEWLDMNAANQVACAGNQHTCLPQIFIPALDKRFDLKFEGQGESTLIGHNLGPRALIWKNTELFGEHEELGKLKVSLKENVDHAGTIIPLKGGESFPAFNRNTYFFVMEIENIGRMISERPAIVEAIIDAVPPTATYTFKNGPLNFYLEGDLEKQTVMILEKAQTHVSPY